ncbi:hypothetical protein L596_025391 [Steinernema carpocapsae]|uniref:Secreted protein n=1 Tax=Steinernema carpocapsae TaxID=34508 RepID=A0A4U5M7M4_STECR|nr:hypothetical protein L596_025391 [Steinernema carpocapsae]
MVYSLLVFCLLGPIAKTLIARSAAHTVVLHIEKKQTVVVSLADCGGSRVRVLSESNILSTVSNRSQIWRTENTQLSVSLERI